MPNVDEVRWCTNLSSSTSGLYSTFILQYCKILGCEVKMSRNKEVDIGLDAVLPIMTSGSKCCKEITALPPHALVSESPLVNVEASTGAFAR